MTDLMWSYLVTLFIFWMASIGNTIFWLIGASMACTTAKLKFLWLSRLFLLPTFIVLTPFCSILQIVVGLHAIFYTPVEVDEFGFGEGLPTTMPTAAPAPQAV